MRNKEQYKANRERVYDLYGVDKKKRSRSWNCHHWAKYRSEGGGDEKANLFPIPKGLHQLLHKRGTKRKEIHQYILDHFGGDPYEN